MTGVARCTTTDAQTAFAFADIGSSGLGLRNGADAWEAACAEQARHLGCLNELFGLSCATLAKPVGPSPGRRSAALGFFITEAMSIDPSPHRERKRRRAANVVGGRRFRHVVKTTDLEEAELVVLAERHGVTVSRLLLQSALEIGQQDVLPERRRVIDELFRLRRDLAGEAVNLNQIAHHANESGEVRGNVADTLAAVRACAEQVNETLEGLRR